VFAPGFCPLLCNGQRPPKESHCFNERFDVQPVLFQSRRKGLHENWSIYVVVLFSSSHIERPRDRSSIIGKGEGCVSDPQTSYRACYPVGGRRSSLRGKRMEHQANHQCQSSAWRCASAPPGVFMVSHECNLPLSI
jgi:hypothetical protein